MLRTIKITSENRTVSLESGRRNEYGKVEIFLHHNMYVSHTKQKETLERVRVKISNSKILE